MIRVRVDWRQDCPGCGTELVANFLDDSACRAACPWCGCEGALSAMPDCAELRDYLSRAISEIEVKANTGITV